MTDMPSKYTIYQLTLFTGFISTHLVLSVTNIQQGLVIF